MNEKRECVRENINRKRIYERSKTLISTAKRKKKMIIIYVIAMLMVQMHHQHNSMNDVISGWDSLAYQSNYIVLNLVIIGFFCMKWSEWFIDEKYSKAFQMIGLVNKVREEPIYLNQKMTDNNFFIIRFNSVGIGIEKWKDKKQEIESALDISISRIKIGNKNTEIIIEGIKGKFDYSMPIYWKNSYLTTRNSLILGESMGKQISVDLDVYPHILLGGSTRSGKTNLLKLLLMQCIKKDYAVYIADFKGKVDFSYKWDKYCHFVTTIEDVISNLDGICKELLDRQIIFGSKGYKDIDIYNEQEENKLQHIVFACDEVAELMDTTGYNKEEKNKIAIVQRKLGMIARLGRAFGIHLLLATQRPSVDVINGAIKNNISARICGRAEKTLSQIILDNIDASDMIDPDIQGMFVNQDGEVFKAYLFKDDCLDRSDDSYGKEYSPYF
jgi:DNA segregation ATPase FtsK/SpoIIIE, S-DNA-T family